MRRPFVMLAVALTAGAGCAGASVEVTAARAAYPLSMSDHVRDSAGVLHGRHSLEKVGELHASGTRIGFFYSQLTPNSTYDISDEVNSQVGAAHGEAVIDLVVKVPPACDLLNMVPIVSVLPMWPGCVNVQVTGDIVRRRPLPPVLPVEPLSPPSPSLPPPPAPPSWNGSPPSLSGVPRAGAGPTRS